MSLAARLMPLVMRARRANRHYRTREHVLRHLEDLTQHPQSVDPPRRPRKDIRISAWKDEGWLIHRITPEASPPRGTVLYLHGGGWVHEAARAHWRWIQRLAAEAQVQVLMPAYPLVQAGGTAATVVPRVAELAGEAERPLVLMGDSAGGSIALSAALMLAQQEQSAALTALISPALDLRFSNPEIDARQPEDPWLVKKGQLELSERWIGEHGEDPLLNPFLGDLTGIGPLLVFSGTRDILNPDTRLFMQRATDDGADVEYHEEPGHLHVYPLLPTPEGRRARRRMVDAVRQATSSTAPTL